VGLIPLLLGHGKVASIQYFRDVGFLFLKHLQQGDQAATCHAKSGTFGMPKGSAAQQQHSMFSWSE
jgi:hypothetical protein